MVGRSAAPRFHSSATSLMPPTPENSTVWGLQFTVVMLGRYLGCLRSVRSGWWRKRRVGEKLGEAAEQDAISGPSIDAVEQPVQRFLGVAEGAFHVRVVAAPEHVIETHRG